jgi:hypothetical protein
MEKEIWQRSKTDTIDCKIILKPKEISIFEEKSRRTNSSTQNQH